MVVLSGFEGSPKKHIFRRQIRDFMTTMMDIEIPIEDHFFIGQNDPKDAVLILPSINEKRILFQNVSKLKKVTNGQGRKYIFREYRLQKSNELHKKMQSILYDMMNNEDVEQEEVGIVQGRIHVGAGVYQKQITPPDPTKLLQMAPETLDRVMSVNLQKGEQYEIKSNLFVGYSICVDNFQTINDAYMKIRLVHADARHIVCAWNIPGIRTYECVDYCDDDDHGCGAAVSAMMTENSITHRAIYIVRKCGYRLNSDRIPTYIQIAKELVNKFQNNPLISENQMVKDNPPASGEQQKKTYASAVNSRGGRGGRGGRRGGGSRRGHGGNYKKRTRENTNQDETKNITYIPPDESTFGSQPPRQMDWNDVE